MDEEVAEDIMELSVCKPKRKRNTKEILERQF
jgi:hypothetical protein